MRRLDINKIVPVIFCALLIPFSVRANVFDTLGDCVTHGGYWDTIDKACKPHDGGKPFDDPTLMPGCQWQNETIEMDATRHINVSFRYQSCGTEKTTYVFDQATGALFKNKVAPENLVAEFRDYAPGHLVQTIEHLNEPTLKPDEKPDCEVTYRRELRGYLYMPNFPYLQDLMIHKPPFTACGKYGFNTEKAQFFRELNDKILVFFHLQTNKDPLDAASFQLQ